VIEGLIAAAFGLLIGSFLNVCIYRWPRDLSVVRPRSYCPGCEKGIAWYDNLPVASYVALGGKCRNCRTSIPFRYPLVELLTGAAFFIGVYMLGFTAAALKFCVFAAMQIALLFSDLEERILPDEFTIGGAIVGVLFAAIAPPPGGLLQMFLPATWDPRVVNMIEAVCGALFLSGVLFGIGELYYRIRRREGLGLGDVKMVGMIAAFLGIPGALFTVVVGSVLGSVTGLLYIWLAKKDAGTYELPFGSFLAVAALLVALQMGPLQRLFQ
jgi:leader peptidase (prepilin peptidase)/N-methyltransferase